MSHNKGILGTITRTSVPPPPPPSQAQPFGRAAAPRASTILSRGS